MYEKIAKRKSDLFLTLKNSFVKQLNLKKQN